MPQEMYTMEHITLKIGITMISRITHRITKLENSQKHCTIDNEDKKQVYHYTALCSATRNRKSKVIRTLKVMH
eukprot:14246894-Ditylum_brightwellii.AAC.1